MSYRENAKEEDPAWRARGPFIVSRKGTHIFRADKITSVHMDSVGMIIHTLSPKPDPPWRFLGDNNIEDLLPALLEELAFECKHAKPDTLES